MPAMRNKPPTPRQIEQLFQDLEDGALSADDHAWLMSLLRGRPEIRAAYRAHMALATGLHDLAEAWAPDHAEPAREHPDILRLRTMRRSFLAAAALIGLLAVAASLIAIRGRMLPPATATAGAGTVWRFDEGGIGGNGSFLPATRVVVDHGTLELVTRHGTRILLEGPAGFEIHDPLRVTLGRGKGWFDVAERDTGFTVLTERLKVIDLGTRFGVATTPASDRVQVESGRVRLESRLPGIPARELTAGRAAEANLVGRTRETAYDHGLFLRALARVPVSIHWSFDGETNGSFPATANGITPDPLRVVGLNGTAATPVTVPGRFGVALDFTSGKYFAESDFPGITGTGPRTIALWFKGRPIPRRHNLRDVDYTPQLVSWGELERQGAYWSFRAHCRAGIVGTQWSGRGWVTAGRIGSQDIHDGHWHHLATVFTGDVDKAGNYGIRHYINGKRVKSTQVVTGVPIDTRGDGSGPASRLRIAFDILHPGGPAAIPVVIDELHVFRAALDDSQVEDLFRDNRISPAH